jgi:hypothetical protein
MLIKLTGIGHPDFEDGKPQPTYIEASCVITIERGSTAQAKHMAVENHRQALQCLWNECERVSAEVNNMAPKTMTPENEQEAAKINKWFNAKQAADALNAACGLVARARQDEYYPMVACTVICLSCGTETGHGVMLSRVFVQESPERVAALVQEAPHRMVPA